MNTKEYEALRGEMVSIDAQVLHKLKIAYVSLIDKHDIECLCPNCHEEYIIRGFICPNCRFDTSSVETEEILPIEDLLED